MHNKIFLFKMSTKQEVCAHTLTCKLSYCTLWNTLGRSKSIFSVVLLIFKIWKNSEWFNPKIKHNAPVLKLVKHQ